MIVYCVTVQVKETNVEPFIEATAENHRTTRGEPGNLRFDVLRSTDDPNRFFLYEVYDSEGAVTAHKETAHYTKWRDTVAGWMAAPREGRMHTVVCPADPAAW